MAKETISPIKCFHHKVLAGNIVYVLVTRNIHMNSCCLWKAAVLYVRHTLGALGCVEDRPGSKSSWQEREG